MISEHPDPNVRRLYAGQVASHTGVSAADLVRVAEKGGSVEMNVPAPVVHAPEGAGFVALSLLIHEWDTIAPWLIGELFADPSMREAFEALAEHDGDVHAAISACTPEAAAVIERASVYDSDADPVVESRSLIAAAVRRELPRRAGSVDLEVLQEQRRVRLALDNLARADRAEESAVELLQWLAAKEGV